MRGSWTDENDQVNLSSAMLQEEALTIAQVMVPEGTNEITQVKAFAKEIGIREGETVLATLDAAHCNKETAKFLRGKQGWESLITVKTDKPAPYRKAAEKIRPLLGRDPDDVKTERGRGVIKTWSCWITEARGDKFPAHLASGVHMPRGSLPDGRKVKQGNRGRGNAVPRETG